MAVRGFFYNATNPNDAERTYNGEDMNHDKAPFYKEGVAYGHLQVTAEGGSMEVKVDGGPKTGYAYINMHTIHNTSVLTLAIEKANGTKPRIDRVIIRNDQVERRPSIFIKKGEVAKTPAPPELVNNGEIQEKSLAQIYVKAGAVEITQADITDERADETVCGFIASQFQDIDFNQLSTQFKAWFDKEKATMEAEHADFQEEYSEMTRAFMNEQTEEWYKWLEEKQNDLSGDIADEIHKKIAVERARIDNIIALEEGSTTGDAELQDIRVGADNKIYGSAGEAVRKQFEYLGISSEITTVMKADVIHGKFYEFGTNLSIGAICSPILCVEDGYFIYRAEVKKGDMFKINGDYINHVGELSGYIVILDPEGVYVQQIIRLFIFNGTYNAKFEIAQDGIIYFSTRLDNFANEEMFSIIRTAVKKIGQNGTANNAEVFNDYENNIASGNYSHAEGIKTQALGAGAHAEGESTIARTTGSHAEGKSTEAGAENGQSYAHAEGINTKSYGRGSHAEGYITVSQADYSHVEGDNSRAEGIGSHAEGRLTRTVGRGSHAEGDSTVAGDASSELSNNISELATYQSQVAGAGAHAEGIGSLAKKAAAHAEGFKTQADGNAAHAEGQNTEASGIGSHSEGLDTIACGDYAHAEGCSDGVVPTLAYGKAAHAEGLGTAARGDGSHTEGQGTSATKKAAHAEGHNTTSSGLASHTEGIGTIASSNYQHVQGKYNVENTNGKYSHIVGGGTSDTDRKNIHTLDWEGNAEFAGDVVAHGCGGNEPVSLLNLYSRIRELERLIGIE